jgi:hypothetical protein
MGGSDIKQDGSMSMWQIFQTFAGLNTMDPNGYTFLKRVTGESVCKDCTVLRGRLQAVYTDGTPANAGNGLYVHHAIFIDVTKKQRLPVSNCGDTMGSIPTFVGADVSGNTWQYFTTQDGTYPSGYYLKDNSMMLQAELVNYRSVLCRLCVDRSCTHEDDRKEPQEVYLELDVEYLTGKVGSDASLHTVASTGEQYLSELSEHTNKDRLLKCVW